MFTDKENKIIAYLTALNGKKVSWEELAQFSKNPEQVKLKSVQKSISEIKRKFKLTETSIPFNVELVSLSKTASSIKPQTLVQVTKTVVPQAKIDFSLDPLGFKRVITKQGVFQLNDSEWDMFKYFYQNIGRLVTISELRDKLVFPNFGSKLPARWFDSIMRVVNNLRRQVFGLDKRLLTVKSSETSYLFQ